MSRYDEVCRAHANVADTIAPSSSNPLSVDPRALRATLTRSLRSLIGSSR
jgi:hypothetical protein